MYKLILYQVKSGWMWKVVYDRGSATKTLARSGQSYTAKRYAKRAFERFMELGTKIEMDEMSKTKRTILPRPF